MLPGSDMYGAGGITPASPIGRIQTPRTQGRASDLLRRAVQRQQPAGRRA